MKIVIAIDSLKGSLSSIDAGNAIAEGIKRVNPSFEIKVCPLADGGEGTVDALVHGRKGSVHTTRATGPLGETVTCRYGIIDHSKTGIIEASEANGITLVPPNERNPLNTTTYGVGEIIKDAVKKGCRRFIVGIGGSATNDGGIGMLQALGYQLLNKQKLPVAFGAKGLAELDCIVTDHVLPALTECEFEVACDVTNTLCGDLGCSAVYGPQKGATTTMIQQMDRWLHNYAKLSKCIYPQANPVKAGSGAAGGLGFAFFTFTNARLESGIDIILKETNLGSYIKDADIVITGEGRLDGQTVMGKAPVGVARLAKKYQKPVIAFAGSVSADAALCNQLGIDAYFPVLREICTLDEAMKPEKAFANMAHSVEQVFRLWNLAKESF